MYRKASVDSLRVGYWVALALPDAYAYFHSLGLSFPWLEPA